MNSKWYAVQIETEKSETCDYMNTLREVVRFIARETGMTQREVRNEVFANQNSSFKRDNLGFRVQVTCDRFTA